MNKTMHTNSRNEGFILLPRDLLRKIIFYINEPVGEDMALLIVLYYCNYSNRDGVKRSEAQLSIAQWSELFHWNSSHTRRFFNNLIETGELTVRYEKNRRILCITHYEEICGKYAAHPAARERDNRKKAPTKTEQDFEVFWERYYEVNKEIEPSDKELAWKEWKKLTAEERSLAYGNIEDYYFSMTDISHSKKAYNYLRHRSFRM